MMDGFQRALDHIRAIAESEAHKGRLFERLMKTYLTKDPIYRERFSAVWLWSEWASERPDFDGTDTGIDLVAEERDGRGYCAIQCKCYAPGTRISKPQLDSFIAASAREPFATRIVVDTGDGWGPNALRTIAPLKHACTVLHFDDLVSRPFDWPDLGRDEPEDLAYRHEPFSLRPHQQAAFDDVIGGFQTDDRGKLVMACGTGKTFVALRIAEEVAGVGGRTLYLVPSIALFAQAMREWATQQAVPHRYIGICSDTTAGRKDEDASLHELEIPVTTDATAVSMALCMARPEAMTVVFCTYQSLGIIEQAQREGAPALDLVLCDEAHRTTGIDQAETKTSPFVLVHDGGRIRAEKRLYMTATPRLYTEGAKTKAARHDVEVFSMDDPETYGPEFHRLAFSRAVEQNLLTDYKVVVLTLSEQVAEAPLQAHLTSDESEINISDATKIIGCWRALQNPERKTPKDGPIRPLARAIAFTNTIKASKRLDVHWGALISQATEQLPVAQQADALRCETRHVDGQHNALDRKARIEWLKGDPDGACRILSNARCLTEGIDVPALDAVLFMSPRNSHIEIVQAVGRVMRKAKGKEYGYIVLPIAVPPGADPADVLDDTDRFSVVWSVLRALRSHDDRLDAEINQIDLNKELPARIIIDPNGGDVPLELPFPPLDLPPGAIFAKIVERCGDRKYWETWAKDVSAIFVSLVSRIENLLDNREHATLREWFDAFLEELRASINESIDRDSAVEMMAQHILTQPVFEALFEHYDFASSNPVAQALDALRRDFGEFGLENEIRDMERFYESVRLRARGLDNSTARQRVLMELYEKFFATAMRKDANRLGIVYTPAEVVDFILNSADQVLRDEFGRSLSDQGVHVLDPFTGTGTFLVRLLQSELIGASDLTRKYREELHANEIVLLAYYIAAVHIEEALHGRREPGSDYEPFTGIVLTDTFNLHTERTEGFPRTWLPDNSERVERQQKAPIQVIVGNPPWSVGQRSSADNNPNMNYPEMEKRVAATYAVRSAATNKNSLYDTYKMAIRWASDRIGDQGVVAVVSNGSWIDGNVDSGVRACLAEEFSSIYVVNLRGNQRTQGDLSRREGGKIFGQGSRASVAITILVRNPNATPRDCRILYHDIGDYLTREQKLAILREANSVAGVDGWHEVAPDQHHDWIGQRSESFQQLYPVGSKAAKAGKKNDAVFALFSQGYQTVGDAYLYSFSRETCMENARRLIGDYNSARLVREEHPDYTVDEIASRHTTDIRWNRTLKNSLRRMRVITYSSNNVMAASYRPFVKQFLYVDPALSHLPGIKRTMFPDSDSDNQAIYISGLGSTAPFSVLIVDTMPDLELVSKGQCFPRYRYQQPADGQGQLPGIQASQERIDNITDTALRQFRIHYRDSTITKDAIFDYIYGLLHAQGYRERFANDLAKELPRIPFAPFHAFTKAGRELAALHLGYERCDEYPLEVGFAQTEQIRLQHFQLGTRAMRFADDEKTELIVNDHLRLRNIPGVAHRYQVNGRTPLEWFIDRYRIRQDKESGIVNDPNGWFDNPRDLVAAIRRIVHVSVESARIIEGLPDPTSD